MEMSFFIYRNASWILCPQILKIFVYGSLSSPTFQTSWGRNSWLRTSETLGLVLVSRRFLEFRNLLHVEGDSQILRNNLELCWTAEVLSSSLLEQTPFALTKKLLDTSVCYTVTSMVNLCQTTHGKGSWLLGRCSTILVPPPDLVIFSDRVSHFVQTPGPWSCYFCFCVDGITGMKHCTRLLCWAGVFFCVGWPYVYFSSMWLHLSLLDPSASVLVLCAFPHS
jgi:hypothetical protein